MATPQYANYVHSKVSLYTQDTQEHSTLYREVHSWDFSKVSQQCPLQFPNNWCQWLAFTYSTTDCPAWLSNLARLDQKRIAVQGRRSLLQVTGECSAVDGCPAVWRPSHLIVWLSFSDPVSGTRKAEVVGSCPDWLSPLPEVLSPTLPYCPRRTGRLQDKRTGMVWMYSVDALRWRRGWEGGDTRTITKGRQ